MPSLYSLYIPKYKNETTEFLITRILSCYVKKTNYNVNILSSPGYMSTSEKTIETFLTKFQKNIADSNNIHLGFFYGMNGLRKVSKTGHTIWKSHIDKISKIPNIQNIPILCKKDNDHRKMLFFFESKGWSFKSKLNLTNYSRFLDCITVNAVLIGSSNQNFTTYYGGRKGTADKGESDLFIFTGDAFKDYVMNQNNLPQNLVLFESLKGAEDSHLYLKEILEDFLKNSLI